MHASATDTPPGLLPPWCGVLDAHGPGTLAREKLRAVLANPAAVAHTDDRRSRRSEILDSTAACAASVPISPVATAAGTTGTAHTADGTAHTADGIAHSAARIARAAAVLAARVRHQFAVPPTGPAIARCGYVLSPGEAAQYSASAGGLQQQDVTCPGCLRQADLAASPIALRHRQRRADRQNP